MVFDGKYLRSDIEASHDYRSRRFASAAGESILTLPTIGVLVRKRSWHLGWLEVSVVNPSVWSIDASLSTHLP